MKRVLLAAVLLFGMGVGPVRAQTQVEDSTFVPKVEKPFFTTRKPVVMIDQAHNNYFTMKSRYRAFASLLTADGMHVIPGVQPFSAPLLKNCQVLVVADASRAKKWTGVEAGLSAFLPSECDAVRDWVRDGGALLFLADPAPFASGMDSLAVRFGVQQGKGKTWDAREVDPVTANGACIRFQRKRGLIGDHPVTSGRDSIERVDDVVVFGGQSLAGPPGSAGLLVLGPASADLPTTKDAWREVSRETWEKAELSEDVRKRGDLPAVGRFQAVAFAYGKGRVVAIGDGAIFGAQRVLSVVNAERRWSPLGINRRDMDNQQFALNVMRWLAAGLR